MFHLDSAKTDLKSSSFVLFLFLYHRQLVRSHLEFEILPSNFPRHSQFPWVLFLVSSLMRVTALPNFLSLHKKCPFSLLFIFVTVFKPSLTASSKSFLVSLMVFCRLFQLLSHCIVPKTNAKKV